MLRRVVMVTTVTSARWAFNCGAWSPSEEEWRLLASGLDAEDKEQVGKFVFKRDAKSAMVGRFLSRKFICEATGLAWRDVRILREAVHKKPFFPHTTGPKVQFNISHSGDFVVLAGEVGDLDLGVDLMKVEKQRTTTVPEFFRLMTKQFAGEEWAVVRAQRTEAEQMAMFYRFWCLKESYTKATGTGITVDLRKICFKLNNLSLSECSVVDDTAVFVDGVRQEGWRFEESLLDKDHISTVALHCTREREQSPPAGQLFTTISYPELVSRYEQVTEYDAEYCRQFMMKKSPH